MAVVKAAADPFAVAVENIYHTARRQACSRLFNHFLENPRMRRTPLDSQTHDRQGNAFGHRLSLVDMGRWLLCHPSGQPHTGEGYAGWVLVFAVAACDTLLRGHHRLLTSSVKNGRAGRVNAPVEAATGALTRPARRTLIP